MLKRVRHLSKEFHMVIHILIGFLIGSIFNLFLEGTLSFEFLIFLGVLAVVPDIEHIVYFYTYGKNTEYSLKAKKYINKFDFYGFSTFCKENHKSQTGLYLHNALTPITLLVFAGYYLQNQFLSSILFVFASHYIFDIYEDILILGKLNKNWFLRFSKI